MFERKFPSFGRRTAARSVESQNPYRHGPPLELGEIESNLSTTNKKYRANIRTYSGALLEQVALPGPFYDSDGDLHGHKMPYEKGQQVLVGYLNGNLGDPIVIQVYPFPGGDTTKQNLSKDQNYEADRPESGHKSGYRMSFQEDKVIWYDKDGNERIVFDFGNDKIQFLKGWTVEYENSAESDKVVIAEADVTAKNDTGSVTLSTHLHPGPQGPTGKPTPGT